MVDLSDVCGALIIMSITGCTTVCIWKGAYTPPSDQVVLEKEKTKQLELSLEIYRIQKSIKE